MTPVSWLRGVQRCALRSNPLESHAAAGSLAAYPGSAALIAEHGWNLPESSAAPGVVRTANRWWPRSRRLPKRAGFLKSRPGKFPAPRRFGRRGRPLWLVGNHLGNPSRTVGVVLVIGPGNYPLFCRASKLFRRSWRECRRAQTRCRRNAAARCLHRLIELAGIDPRLVGILPEAAEAARMAIAARPDKVLFTGSAAVGEKVCSNSRRNSRRRRWN